MINRNRLTVLSCTFLTLAQLAQASPYRSDPQTEKIQYIACTDSSKAIVDPLDYCDTSARRIDLTRSTSDDEQWSALLRFGTESAKTRATLQYSSRIQSLVIEILTHPLGFGETEVRSVGHGSGPVRHTGEMEVAFGQIRIPFGDRVEVVGYGNYRCTFYSTMPERPNCAL